MIEPPSFFERIRAEAAWRCDLLEDDPVLAAPARQLFKQIKNPLFVVSELLQNADDAGARRVRAWIEGGVFYFEHDGADFEEEHLASLCRFGFSNKRHLHTIGFRGLGFKSVFSYGPEVQLTTPTLAIRFSERRFTDPVWDAVATPPDCVRIAVPFGNPEVAEVAARELQRWAADPVPLLFFRHIEALELGGRSVRRVVVEPGPVPGSEWVDLEGTDHDMLLVVRSPDEPLPADAVAEIRGEREDAEFATADAAVQLVLRLNGPHKLYVVLPTTVQWSVPFSVNAPFVQDPARTAIKNPSLSPLNRWLLDRAGRLAAETLLGWLGRNDLPLDDRAEAYDWLGPVKHGADTLAGSVGARVTDAMRAALQDRDVVLTSGGHVRAAKRAFDLPPDLDGIWTEREACALFSPASSGVLAPPIPPSARDAMSAWGLVERVERTKFVELLNACTAEVPRPRDDALERLWGYLESAARAAPYSAQWVRTAPIVPVKGSSRLWRGHQVVVADESVDKLTDDEWSFLAQQLPLVDLGWVERIENTRAASSPAKPDGSRRAADAAALWDRTGLAKGMDLSALVARAALTLSREKTHGDYGIRLARLAARVGAVVPDSFEYLTALETWLPVNLGLVAPTPEDRDLFPPVWLKNHELSAAYERGMSESELRTWRTWVDSPASRLRRFPVPTCTEKTIYGGRRAVQALYKERGGTATLNYPYERNNFKAVDYDFAAEFWAHWHRAAVADPQVWPRMLTAVGRVWSRARDTVHLEIRQEGTKYYQTLGSERLDSRWIHRLRQLACVPNEFDRLEQPGALLRHGPNTTFLRGIEPFVHPDFDRTELHPLLDQLGIRTDPTDAETLLRRLRALAALPLPPEDALERVYAALDRLVARLPGDRAEHVVEVFAAEPLVRTADGAWATSEGVFASNPERIPGVSVLWERVAALGLWRQLGVEQRPTAEMVLDWLKKREPGEKLEGAARQRVRQLLAGMPERVWLACRAWIDLEGRWTPGDKLRYRTGRPADWQRLFSVVRGETADTSMLPADFQAATLLGHIPALEEVNEQRLTSRELRVRPRPEWLSAVAQCVLRIPVTELLAVRAAEVDETPPAEHPDHSAAREALRAEWATADVLEVQPYVQGRLAGPTRATHAVWSGGRIIVQGGSSAYCRELVGVLSAKLVTPAVQEAVALCVERTAPWVEDYFDNQFTLGPAVPVDMATGAGVVPAGAGAPLVEALAATGAVWAVTASQTAGVVALDDTDLESDNSSRESEEGEDEPEPRVHVREHTRSWPTPLAKVLAVLEQEGYLPTRSADRLAHPDGGWADLTRDALVHATAYDAGGGVRRLYWAGEDPLDRGVEIPAETWSHLDRHRRLSRVVVPEGAELRCYPLDALDVFPAQYRLRLRVS